MKLNLSESFIYVPFPRKLYDDIVRCSDGGVDPVHIAQEQLMDLMRFGADDLLHDWFGERVEEFVSIYFPDILEEWEAQDAARVQARLANAKPMIWKAVSIPAGSEVRMLYQGVHHLGKINGGAIEYEGQHYKPSQWASKVADRTSRNAWRDLWFKFPASSAWVSAMTLREQASAETDGVAK